MVPRGSCSLIGSIRIGGRGHLQLLRRSLRSARLRGGEVHFDRQARRVDEEQLTQAETRKRAVAVLDARPREPLAEIFGVRGQKGQVVEGCLLYTSPSPRD